MTPAEQTQAGDFIVTRCRARLSTAMTAMLMASDDDRHSAEIVVQLCEMNLATAQRIVTLAPMEAI